MENTGEVECVDGKEKKKKKKKAKYIDTTKIIV